MTEYSYKLDTSQVSGRFRRLIAKTPSLCRRILGFISEAIVNRTVIHHLSGQTLKRQTGTLAKSINYKITSDYSSIVGTNVKYAAIHEFGGIILPVNKSALRFKIKDQWITTKKVVMPQRSYLKPSIEYVMEREAVDITNKRVQEYLDKEWTV